MLLAIPALLALLFVGSRATESGGQFAFEVFYFLVVPILIPLTTLILATSALGGEVEEGTIIYLTLKPVSRATIVVAKLLAALLVSVVLVEISSILTYVIATGGNIVLQDLGAITGAALAGCIAYTAVFLPLLPAQARSHRRLLLRAVLGGNAVGPLYWSGHTLRTPLRTGSPRGWPRLIAARKPAPLTGFRYGQRAGRPWPASRWQPANHLAPDPYSAAVSIHSLHERQHSLSKEVGLLEVPDVPSTRNDE
jgi:hypothetical protein